MACAQRGLCLVSKHCWFLFGSLSITGPVLGPAVLGTDFEHAAGSMASIAVSCAQGGVYFMCLRAKQGKKAATEPNVVHFSVMQEYVSVCSRHFISLPAGASRALKQLQQCSHTASSQALSYMSLAAA